MKQILDANNAFVAQGKVSATATHCDMAGHNNEMVRQLALGQFLPTPIKVFDEKRITLGIAHWLPLSADMLANNKDTFERAESQAAHQATDDDDGDELMFPEHMTEVGQVYAMICNFVADSNTMWVSDDEKNVSWSRRL